MVAGRLVIHASSKHDSLFLAPTKCIKVARGVTRIYTQEIDYKLVNLLEVEEEKLKATTCQHSLRCEDLHRTALEMHRIFMSGRLLLVLSHHQSLHCVHPQPWPMSDIVNAHSLHCPMSAPNTFKEPTSYKNVKKGQSGSTMRYDKCVE